MRTLINLASTFLGGRGGNSGYSNSNSRSDSPNLFSGGARRISQLPNIKQFLPGANDNFGVSQGEGIFIKTFKLCNVAIMLNLTNFFANFFFLIKNKILLTKYKNLWQKISKNRNFYFFS